MVHTFVFAALLAAASEDADLLIKGGMLVDGTGAAARRADVAVRGDRIVAVGDLGGMKAARVIDAAGLVVAPGFIDLHTHSDSGITAEATRANRNYLTQGVTTIVTGNCGGGPTDVAKMFATIDAHGAGTNVIHLISHGSLRAKVVGEENRPATPDELAEMKELVAREMKAGTWGMSTGLIYTPGCFAPTEELIELAGVVAEHGGIYASHIRGEGDDTLISSITEAIRIGREAKLPVHISHLKASGRAAWGMMSQVCRLIEEARAAGQSVTADQYPYTASSTSLAAMIVPAADREGGSDELAKRLADPARGPVLRERIARELAERGGPDTIRIASFAKNRSWQGKSLAEIAAAESRPAHEIAIEILEHGGASAVSFSMSEDDVRLAMQKPYVATASDGSARVPDETVPHPRSYGCFPRKIGRYAIADKIISLEHAVRSASGLPADILKLPQRGYIKPGYFADLVIFDPATFRDVATFDRPHQYSTGVRFVFVNGRAAIDAGEFIDTLAGIALRHTATPPGDVRRELPSAAELVREAILACDRFAADEQPVLAIIPLAEAQVYAGDYPGAMKTARSLDGMWRTVTMVVCLEAQAEVTGDFPGIPADIGELPPEQEGTPETKTIGESMARCELIKFHARAGRFAEARQEADRIPIDRGSAYELAKTLTLVAREQLARKDRGASATLKRAKAVAARTPWVPRQVEILQPMVDLWVEVGDRETAVTVVRLMDGLAEKHTRTEPWSRYTALTYGHLGTAYAAIGDADPAGAAFWRAIEIAEGIEDSPVGDSRRCDQVKTLADIGAMQFSASRKADAAGSFSKARQYASQIGEELSRNGAMRDIVQAQFQSGDFAGAIETTDLITSPYWQCLCLCKIAMCDGFPGRSAERRQLVDRAGNLARSEGDAKTRADMWVDVAEAQAKLGDIDASRRSLEIALEISNASLEKLLHQRIACEQVGAGLFREAYATIHAIDNPQWRALPLAQLARAVAERQAARPGKLLSP